jgi:hypothetical protein
MIAHANSFGAAAAMRMRMSRPNSISNAALVTALSSAPGATIKRLSPPRSAMIAHMTSR